MNFIFGVMCNGEFISGIDYILNAYLNVMYVESIPECTECTAQLHFA